MPYVRSAPSGSSRKAYTASAKKSKSSKLAAARSLPTGARTLAPSVKKAVAKIAKASAEKVADKRKPDTIITTFKATFYNSGIGSADVGYLFGSLSENNVGGLALPVRLAAVKGLPPSTRLGQLFGNGLHTKYVTYYGDFVLDPNAFWNASSATGFNVRQNHVCIVHCMVLYDKYNREGDVQDRNCINDLLVDNKNIWPNSATGFTSTADAMIAYSGTIFDENLSINRERFGVIAHKKWAIRPTAINVLKDEIPTINQIRLSVLGNLRRTFRIKIPTPKIIKWDRRDFLKEVGALEAQHPRNVNDPFVVWGYTPIGGAGPDVADTNLHVRSFTKWVGELDENSPGMESI